MSGLNPNQFVGGMVNMRLVHSNMHSPKGDSPITIFLMIKKK